MGFPSLKLAAAFGMRLGPAAAAEAPKIAFEKFALPNGLQIILHEDRKLPVVHVNLWYHVGSKNERPGRTGFAHLFEHMMFQGSKNVKEEYISLMERAGANIREGGINGTTDFDRTNYFETVPSGSLELVLFAESDRMGYLLDALSQEKLDNQRDVVKNERRQRLENAPYGRWEELLFESLFPKGHPYSWHVIGSMEDLSRASLEDIKEFFQTYYTPNNCTLVIAGDFDAKEARRLVEKYFGLFPPGPPLVRPERFVPALEGERRLVVSDRVPQERLYLAWPGVPFFDPDDAALDLLSRLLADGKNSRLYKRMVYDEQVASDVSAFNYPLEIAGLVGVVATARPEIPLARIEALIDEEIARFSRDGPSEEEMARVKAKQEFDFLSGLERIGGFGGKADRLAQYNTYLGSPDFIGRDYQRYQNLSGEELRSAAERHLNPRRLVVSFVPETAQRPASFDLDRSQTPPPGARSSFTAPVVSSDRLPNGLAIRVVERHEIPKVAVSLVVKAGADAEHPERAGLAWMVAEMLDEGTATRSALQIEAELDRLGSRLSTGASREWSSVSLESLKRSLDGSLELMADVVLHPRFPATELERVQKQRLDEILQERANPGATASRLARKILFGPDHPYGRPVGGEEGSIKGLARNELDAFYGRHYTPADAVLIFAGDITLSEARAAAEKVFSFWKGTPPARANLVPVQPGARRVCLIDRAGAAQSEIRAALLAPERSSGDYYAIEVLNTILGGGFTSRLNLNLREDKGYSYGAFSFLGYGRFQSLWMGYAPVQTAATRDSLAEILKEIEALASWSRPVSEKELADAKATLVRGYAQRFETVSQVVGELVALEGHRLSAKELSRYTAGVEKVTLAEIRAVAGKYLSPDEVLLVVVGDRSRIEADIRGLSLGPVHVLDAEGEPVEARS